MFSFPESAHPIAPQSFGEALASGLPRAYAVLFYSANARFGWFLIMVTLAAPDMGLLGIAGVTFAAALAWVLGFDRHQLRNGYLLFNPLLASLTVGWLHRSYQFPMNVELALWAGACVGALFLAVAMNAAFGQLFGLSSHSLPAVVVAYVLYFLGFSLYGPAPLSEVSGDWLDLSFLPPLLQVTGESFGAMLFMPKTLPGLLVLGGLIVTSRLSAILALAGFAAGYGSMKFLGFAAEPEGVLWCGFNFLLCGLSLGGGYYVPSRASLALGTLAAALCAPVAIAVAEALRYFALPPSALPGNFIILALAYALRQRQQAGGLIPCPAPGSGPERNARLILINAMRFPDLLTPALALPFEGERVITQGFSGALTHRGAWRHALDFERYEGDRSFRGAGVQLDDFYTFDAPVLAPCAGTIARVVDGVPDNLPGQNNTDQNWGNYVLIRADAGYHVLLSHFKKSGVQVAEGQRVRSGDLLGQGGNSGRSPVPHVHLHVQDTPAIGAPTRPFCLKHYLEPTDAGKTVRYRTSGVPTEGSRISSAVMQIALGDALAGWLPGEYRYRISAEQDVTWEESLILEFDDLGRFRLRSRRHGGQVTMFISEGVFYATDFVGKGESLLAIIAMGLARVPFLPDTKVRWTDAVSAVPFMAAPLRWAHDTLDPFTGPAVLECEYQNVHELTGSGVLCLMKNVGAPAGAPVEIMTRFDERSGISRIGVRFGNDRRWSAECVKYAPIAV